MDCTLAVLRAQQKDEENREHEELKRRTLAAFDERLIEEKEIDGISWRESNCCSLASFSPLHPDALGSAGLAYTVTAGRGRGNQKARRQQTQQTQQRILNTSNRPQNPTSLPAGGSAARSASLYRFFQSRSCLTRPPSLKHSWRIYRSWPGCLTRNEVSLLSSTGCSPLF